MFFYTAPSESYPMSFETMKTLSQLAKDVQAATGRISMTSKSILKMADSHSVTSEDIAALYSKECRYIGINDEASEAIYKVRLEQPFSNDFYKDPETGFNDPGDDEE